MEEENTVDECFVISMRMECLRLASCNLQHGAQAVDVVKEATILFNFLVDDIPSNHELEETQERTN